MGILNKIKNFFNTPYERSIRQSVNRFTFFNRDIATNETIFSAVSMLSNGIASAPFSVHKEYEKLLPGQNQIAKLLKYGPNPRMTMFNFMKTMEVLRCTKGAAYAIKEYSAHGEVSAIWVLDTNNVQPMIEQESNELYYKIQDITGTRYVHNSHIIAVTYMTTDGYTPISPLDVLRNTIDYDNRIKEFNLEQLTNGLKCNLIIKMQTKLNEKSLEEYNTMLSNFKKNGILYVDSGKDFQELQNSFIDPNVLATENITVERVERVYNMPGKLTKGSSTNSGATDTEDLLYLKDAMLPVIRMYEQEFTVKLISSFDRDYKGIEIKGNMRGFARATLEKRGNFYQQMIRCGSFSPNLINILEDLPTYEGGDVHYVSRDLCPVDQIRDLINSGSNTSTPTKKFSKE